MPIVTSKERALLSPAWVSGRTSWSTLEVLVKQWIDFEIGLRVKLMRKKLHADGSGRDCKIRYMTLWKKNFISDPANACVPVSEAYTTHTCIDICVCM